MSVDRLLDQLVSAAAISAEQADLARGVDLSIAASAAGRLEACGLDGDAMLAAVSQVSGIAVAPAQLLTRARRVVVKGGDPEVLRRLLAFPAGADKAGRLQVLIADPESATHLPHLGLPDYRAWLAPERIVRELIAALPDEGPEVVTGVDDQMRMLRALTHGVSDVRTGLELGGAPATDQDQFTTQSDLKRPSAESLAAAAAQPRAPAPVLPRTPSPPPWAPTPATQSPTERALPRSQTPPVQPSAPVAPPPSMPRPAAKPSAGDAYQAAVGELPPAITFLPPMREAPAEPARPPPAPLPKPPPTGSAPDKKRPPVALLAGVGVVVVLAIVAAAIVLGRGTPPAADPADQRQRQLLADARAKAAAGDHAWAFSACSDAIAAKPGTNLALDAALLCAQERVALGERLDAANELRKLIAALPATDPRRAKAEALLAGIVGPTP